MTPITETFVILDFETTGLDPACDQIIEIAALKVASTRQSDGTYEYREIGRLQTLVALEWGRTTVDAEITKLTGITAQMLGGTTPEPNSVRMLSEFIEYSTVIAHSAPFDLSFFFMRDDAYDELPFICTRAMAKLLEPDESASLENVYKRLTLEEIPNHHRAMNDVLATFEVFKTLRDEAERRGVEYRNVVVDSEERPLTFVPSGAKVVRIENIAKEVA